MSEKWIPIVRRGGIEVSATPKGYVARITMSATPPAEWIAAYASPSGPQAVGDVRVGRPAGAAIDIVFTDGDQLEPSVEHALACVDYANARAVEATAERQVAEDRHEAQRIESASRLVELQRRAAKL
jgi:hypothetical protein